MPALTRRALAQFVYRFHLPFFEIYERTPEEPRIFDGSFMGFRRLDVRLHDFQVPLGNISGQSGRRNQMGPGIPAIDQGFRNYVLLQIIKTAAHSYYYLRHLSRDSANSLLGPG